MPNDDNAPSPSGSPDGGATGPLAAETTGPMSATGAEAEPEVDATEIEAEAELESRADPRAEPTMETESAAFSGGDPTAGSAKPLTGDTVPLRRPYHQIWVEAALRLIHDLSHDTAWTAEAEPAERAAPLPVELAAHWELTGAVHGKLAIKMHRGAARAWARLLLPADTPPASLRAELDGQEREALAEFMRRFAEAVTAGLERGGWGKIAIQIRHIGPLRRRVEDGSAEFPLRFLHAESMNEPAAEPMELDLIFDSSLKEEFRHGPRFKIEPPANAPITANRLDLLLDVELDVTLRFGGRQMLLHDVLELAPGSVLELDRHIDDPVELLVGGKIIAWGEVVVVDGNYGLRVTRLVQRSERMAMVGV